MLFLCGEWGWECGGWECGWGGGRLGELTVDGRPGELTSAISSFATVIQQYSAYSPTCRTSLLRDVRHLRLPVVPVY
ncbi:hypothetical protein [Fundicoccus culcitae]|uniref:Uncharacterized protein n=1 Tax=Fundicoccus culcitae TaxID=2969821 RepID=A0ABY5P4C0_9LACT|nr:hypothetical protein [Fundicoccus culcitae]UUX33460.1 hypothetical protein NRE15_11200 [Fundicoccus culcitae]